MRLLTSALLVIGLLATAAWSDLPSGLSDAVDSARGSLSDRLDILGGIEDPSRDQKREGKHLQKALDKFGAYLGEDDKGDLRRCCQAVKKLLKSDTEDSDIQSALEAIKDALDTLAVQVRDEAVDLLKTVKENKQRSVERLIDRGKATRSAALLEWPLNPKKCITKLVKAVGLFRKALAKAEKFQEEPGTTPDDVYVYFTSLFNNSDEVVQITDITYSVYGTLGGAPYNYGGKASETHPHLLPISIPVGDSYDFLPITTTLAKSDPNRPALIPGDIVGASYTLHTTAGDFSSQ